MALDLIWLELQLCLCLGFGDSSESDEKSEESVLRSLLVEMSSEFTLFKLLVDWLESESEETDDDDKRSEVCNSGDGGAQIWV